MTFWQFLNIIPLSLGIIMLVNNDWFAEQWYKKYPNSYLGRDMSTIRKRVIIISIIVILLSIYKMLI